MQIIHLFSTHYYQARRWIDRLPLYGRAGILAASLLLTLSVWYLLIQLPVTKSKSILVAQMETIQKLTGESNQRSRSILTNVTGGNAESQKKENALIQEEKNTEQYLQVLQSEIIPPEKMSEVLRDVLAKDQNLKLQSFRILPRKNLVRISTTSGKTKPTLYQQDFQVMLSGTYFDTLSYLQQLEGLSWRFFWDSIEYTVQDYPNAKIVIQLHTLGQ